ncbi:hypothetical protein P153DRAFT_431401 [Dothidotthia symphoricarpi CBS 119687]|uniref:Uncharacterized protein n=1 Tax=Dothidotthia symphoricarpi CBS 119687 TaxID=1392245 RepID=A0A6A6AER9_9PLEO|nr:uncharacterized protein P153DRAFT_431401 [Dothidotthia symphoricarpi CBS 119687]KAF2129444.1 hypothetical protein P153DRAFT_431401 [Dothidotthia symphoricarpi CBS 119687]
MDTTNKASAAAVAAASNDNKSITEFPLKTGISMKRRTTISLEKRTELDNTVKTVMASLSEVFTYARCAVADGCSQLNRAIGSSSASQTLIPDIACALPPRQLFGPHDKFHLLSLSQARKAVYYSAMYDMVRASDTLKIGLSHILQAMHLRPPLDPNDINPDTGHRLPGLEVQNHILQLADCIRTTAASLRALVARMREETAKLRAVYQSIEAGELKECRDASHKQRKDMVGVLMARLLMMMKRDPEDANDTQDMAHAEGGLSSGDRLRFETEWKRITAWILCEVFDVFTVHANRLDVTLGWLEKAVPVWSGR